MEFSCTSLKDLIDLIQTIVTIIAIVVGGVWTYFLFVKKRLKFPHASMSHQIFYKPISTDKALLNVKTVLTNSGDVLLSLESGEVRVQQILPIPPDIEKVIDEKQDPVPEDRTEIDWPLLGMRTFDWPNGKCEIEPGENDHFVADFIVDADVRLVTVYSYFKNTKKRNRDIGWCITTVYEVGGDMRKVREKEAHNE